MADPIRAPTTCSPSAAPRSLQVGQTVVRCSLQKTSTVAIVVRVVRANDKTGIEKAAVEITGAALAQPKTAQTAGPLGIVEFKELEQARYSVQVMVEGEQAEEFRPLPEDVSVDETQAGKSIVTVRLAPKILFLCRLNIWRGISRRGGRCKVIDSDQAGTELHKIESMNFENGVLAVKVPQPVAAQAKAARLYYQDDGTERW